MRDNIYQRGASLVFALFLMCFLTIVSFSLIWLIRDESKSTTKLYISQRALYAAEAGIERKIAELKEENSSDIALTTLNESQYVVTVNSAGTDRFEITSTGYAPSLADPKEKRKLSVVVLVNPVVPEHAIALGGSGVINSNITIYGTIRSNDRIIIGSNVTITESSAGKGDASIYTAYNGAVQPAIDIGSNFHVSVSGQYMKCRLDNEGTGPDEHAPKTSDGGTSLEIYDEDNITEKANVTIVEGDTSSDTDEISIPSVDIDALIADADYTYDRNNLPLDPPWDWDATNGYFDYTLGTWDMEGKTYNFKEGLRFNTNINITGPGTIIVSSGTAEYGIEMNSNIHGTNNGDYAYMNVIVSGGTWEEDDLRINSNVMIQGYVYASSSATINSNVKILGVVECGEGADIKTNITITHSDDIPMDLPWAEGSSGLVEIVSWQEVNP